MFWFRIFLNSSNALFSCDAVRSYTSSISLSLVAIYEFMSFSVSAIYVCILISNKSACLHSQPRYAEAIWEKGWHIGEIPSVRGKKDDTLFFHDAVRAFACMQANNSHVIFPLPSCALRAIRLVMSSTPHFNNISKTFYLCSSPIFYQFMIRF